MNTEIHHGIVTFSPRFEEIYNIHALVEENVVFIPYMENQVSYFVEIK